MVTRQWYDEGKSIVAERFIKILKNKIYIYTDKIDYII